MVSPPKHEVRIGWIFHFIIGGGVVGTIYPFYYFLFDMPLPSSHLITGLAYGFATSLLPWLILLPSFGWGLFGIRAPKGANPLLASTLSHIPYGLGLGVVLNLGLMGKFF